MTTDPELARWREEWSFDTEPLPELRQRVRAQNRRLAAGGVLLAVCLAAGAVLGLRLPASAWGGFALGLWLAALVGGGYALWVRRGTWAVAAQTTGAYADLLHRRAVATLAKTVFLRRCLTVVLVAYGAWLLWTGPRIAARAMPVVGLLAAEAALFRVLERRRRRAVDETARLAARASNDSDEVD